AWLTGPSFRVVSDRAEPAVVDKRPSTALSTTSGDAMHRPRNALGGVLAVAVAAIAFSGSAVAGNDHGKSGNAPGQQTKQAAKQQSAQPSHGKSANAPGHKKQKHSQSSVQT